MRYLMLLLIILSIVACSAKPTYTVTGPLTPGPGAQPDAQPDAQPGLQPKNVAEAVAYSVFQQRRNQNAIISNYDIPHPHDLKCDFTHKEHDTIFAEAQFSAVDDNNIIGYQYSWYYKNENRDGFIDAKDVDKKVILKNNFHMPGDDITVIIDVRSKHVDGSLSDYREADCRM